MKLRAGEDPAIVFDFDKGIMRCTNGVAFLTMPYDEVALAENIILPYFAASDGTQVVFVVVMANDEWLGLDDNLASLMRLDHVRTEYVVVPDDLEAWAAGSYKAAMDYRMNRAYPVVTHTHYM